MSGESGKALARTGLTIAGAYFFGPLGMIGGAMLGNIIFPADNDVEMPEMGAYPVQNSGKSEPIQKCYGTVLVAGNLIYMGETHPYTVSHSVGGGGGKGGGGGGAEQTETRYRKSFLIGICQGTAAINRAWAGKTEISPDDEFTTFDGSDNSGISALIGEDFAEYKHICCAWFSEYELGNTEQIPNFTFEVISGVIDPTLSKTQIWSVQDLQDMNLDVTGDYELMVDLTIPASFVWTPIGDAGGVGLFTGTFDGRFHTINYTQTSTTTNDVSVFGEMSSPVVIENVRIIFEITTTTFSAPASYGVFGRVGGGATITNCAAQGKWIFSATTERVIRIGGFTGSNSSMTGSVFTRCSAVVEYECWSPVETRLSNVGGFTGHGGGTHIDCYARGKFTKAHIGVGNIKILFNLNFFGGMNSKDAGAAPSPDSYINCYSAFDTSAIQAIDQPKIMGIVGDAQAFSIGANCFWNKDITEDQDDLPSGSTSKTTGQMQTQSTFESAGWDFDDVWYMRTDALTGDVWPELQMSRRWTSGLANDENPSAVIKDFLVNDIYGAGIDQTTYINTDTFDDVADYCTANDLFFSFVFKRQRPVMDYIDYILSHFQGYLYMSQGKINLGVFKNDASTFTITQSNLVTEEGENPPPPVQVNKRPYSETANRVEITWLNRSALYDRAVAIALDETDIRVSNKIRKKTIDLTGITTENLAQKIVYRMLFESLYRFSRYSFVLSYKDMMLEVGDVGSISDGELITDQRIRITSISESKDGKNLQVEAVEDLAYMYPDLSGYQGEVTDHTPDPDFGDLIASPLYAYREHRTAPILHISLTPQNIYANGWYLYRSYDDVSYELVGKIGIDGITGGDANSQGTLSTNLPAHTAIVHKVNESFIVNIGTVTDLQSGTEADFFANRKICKIDDEVIGYKTAVELSAGVWQVSELIRGLYNTAPVAHASGASFKTLDINFNLTYTDADIGRTMYFKALTFYGSFIQNIADVSSSSRVIIGTSRRPLPVSLMRIRYREGKTTYETDDVVIDWYFASRTAGFNVGGHGDILWGAYTREALIETINALLEEEDGTDILEETLAILDDDPMSLFIPVADRDGKNPVKVSLTAGSILPAPESRTITIEQI